MWRVLSTAAALALVASAYGMTAASAAVYIQDVGDITDPTTASAADSTFPVVTSAGPFVDYMVFNVTGPYPTFSFSGSETNNGSSASSSYLSSGELQLYSCSTVGCGVPPGPIPTGNLPAITSGAISPKITIGGGPAFFQDASIAWSDLPKGPYYVELLATASSNTAFFPSANFTVSGIPEASTWVMMALGFAGLGYAAFRRSAKGRLAGRSI